MAVNFGKRPQAKLKWDGVPQMKATFLAVGNALNDKTPEVKAVILPPCQTAMDRARELAPILAKPIPGVQPGMLRASIYATLGRSTYRGVLMTADKKIAYYAPWVEYGTSKMQARPYFRPAITQMQGTYLGDIAPGVQKLIEDAAAKAAYHLKK